MKIYAMIPCRLGSKRIPKKNLRLLGDKTLSQWVASTVKETDLFDEIYINSEADIFEKVAQQVGVKYYKRPEQYATDSATNDEFALDFINAFEFDVLVQINPTSPFLSKEDIINFISEFKSKNLQTLHTVKNEKIEGLYEGTPLNFDPLKPMPPSQLLTPVKLFSSSIMAWNVKKFRENMTAYNCAVYGGDGSIGYFPLTGFSSLDIDNEIDFKMAEIILNTMKTQNDEKKYFNI
jgi:CMP-N-acetylneuraminic acid synthetase